MVQLLISRGALLNRDFQGLTPLHLAAREGFTRTMELLVTTHTQLLDQRDKTGVSRRPAGTSDRTASCCVLARTMFTTGVGMKSLIIFLISCLCMSAVAWLLAFDLFQLWLMSQLGRFVLFSLAVKAFRVIALMFHCL